MTKTKIVRIKSIAILIFASITFTTLTGCSLGPNTSEIQEVKKDLSSFGFEKQIAKGNGSTSQEVSALVQSSSIGEHMEITISAVDYCQTKIGMFSVIDPITGEQVNIGSIDAMNILDTDTSWPVGENDFLWAIYDENGKLIKEGRENVSVMKSGISIVFVGNEAGEFDNQMVTVE